MHSLQIKPLSVNKAWKGQRFKTKAYQQYEKAVLCLLPKKLKIPEAIRLEIEFGFSNPQSDVDNPVKCFVDILQQRYKFNDSQVWEMELRKKITTKGAEYIKFEILPITTQN